MKDIWTLEKVPDLTGKIIVVTGGNSGIGFETVKAFAAKGAEIVLASRSPEKGESAKSEILKTHSNGKITVYQLDLMELNSIKNFADKFTSNYNRLDILMNNAGIMMPPYGLTKDGFESQIGTNHLGHFALTGHLMKLLIKTPKSRVVTTSSLAHKSGVMDFDNFLFEKGKGYTPIKAYGRSKLANLLFTLELDRLFKKNKTDCTAVSAHPGVSFTNLGRFMEKKLLYKLISPIFKIFTHSPYSAALPQIRAAVDTFVRGSDFFGPDGFKEMKGNPVLTNSNEASHNLEDAKKLWTLSEELTGVKYEF